MIKSAVEVGDRPEFRGRPSCLLLEVGGTEIML